MQLSPRALQALIDIKKDLLSHELPQTAGTSPNEQDVTARRDVPVKAQPTIRRVRSSNAFQRACQRHTFWSPVY